MNVGLSEERAVMCEVWNNEPSGSSMRQSDESAQAKFSAKPKATATFSQFTHLKAQEKYQVSRPLEKCP